MTNKLIKAIIVDDEELGRVNLLSALRAFPEWNVVALCESVASASLALEQHQVDVVFLDIQMPEVSGLVLARRLSQTPNPPVIVFVTAYDGYALHAFEYFALDYLLKPFSNQRLQQTLERASQMIQMRQKSAYSESLQAYVENSREASKVSDTYLTRVTIRSIGELEVVSLDTVSYLSSAGNYVELATPQGSKLLRLTMNAMEEKLNPSIFVRIHRSHMVRISEIEKLSDFVGGTARLSLRNGPSFPVSQAYLAKLKEAVLAS
ncbi:LytTR family DNA-binding domain-containing protein [Undibacterium cyanobacteriorum]|uniref:LytTR family DNA-binding domain-containing protein n=1 Tax=Undibacterium cyanobacteriorum TaxID=3073561 RepID=A0ABY9RH67_9BURK|nr:LytTR family DNA-binding domain-containing protein [Undibacterium sp. 20NA77.5]WMW80555.1 LytTR family DNA-binding domain-containing protein [Undibacterium sp. 20NA77.5]